MLIERRTAHRSFSQRRHEQMEAVRQILSLKINVHTPAFPSTVLFPFILLLCESHAPAFRLVVLRAPATMTCVSICG